MAVKRRIYRLRFLNASNAHSYNLKLGKGRQMLQIASNSGLLGRRSRGRASRCTRRSGSKCSIDFRGFKPGSQISACRTRGRVSRDQRGHALRRRRRRRNRGSAHAARPDADHRAATQAESDPQLGPVARDRLGHAMADRQPRLRPGAHDVRPRLGTSELWHGATRPTACIPCTCTASSCGSSSAAAEPCTAASADGKTRSACLPGKTVMVQPYFGPYAGRYVFHCHALEHADKAMMLQLEVVK